MIQDVFTAKTHTFIWYKLDVSVIVNVNYSDVGYLVT